MCTNECVCVYMHKYNIRITDYEFIEQMTRRVSIFQEKIIIDTISFLFLCEKRERERVMRLFFELKSYVINLLTSHFH